MKKNPNHIINLLLLIVMLFLVSQPTPVYAVSNWYASPGGTGDCTIGNTCSLWYAVANANNGDTIYLTYGPYTAQLESDDEVLYIDKSLTIIGGCDPSFTTCELGYQYESSIFDGDNPGNTWAWTRVITIQGEPKFRPTVVLKNLHIVRGNGYGIVNDVPCISDGSSATVGCGGGIYANQVASLTIQNCSFYNNSGAIESFAGAPAAGYGGAIYLQDVSNIHIINNEFNSNQAYVSGRGYGGAIALVDVAEGVSDQLEIKGNYFFDNDCGQVGTTTIDKGCGIYLVDSPKAYIVYNEFRENNTPSTPQLLVGAALYANNSGGLHILSNTFTGNWGSSAVEVWNDSATPDDAFERNKFWDNDVNYLLNYNGIYWVMIRNNFFGHNAPIRNDPLRGGGQTGIHLVTSGTPADNPSAWVFFNTFAALDTGFVSDDVVLVESYYNIFAHIDGTAVVGGDSTAVVKNLYWDNITNGDTGSMPVYADPNLVDVYSGDFHLAFTSAATDKASSGLGVPSEDIDMQVRPYGSGTTPYDLGADELRLEIFLPMLFK